MVRIDPFWTVSECPDDVLMMRQLIQIWLKFWRHNPTGW
jgi:hypothetical protein